MHCNSQCHVTALKALGHLLGPASYNVHMAEMLTSSHFRAAQGRTR
jgi:hypothetical protein